MHIPSKQALASLPERFSGPSAWSGKVLRDTPEQWLYELTPQDVADLESAAQHFLALDLDVGAITKDTFPLTSFSRRVHKLKQHIMEGLGFEVLRGLPVSLYDRKMTAAIFCGIGAHLGRARSQNAQGHILGHVRDIGADPKDPTSRIYQTHERQTFHTDSTDVVGLLCLKPAKSGGLSLLVSAESIYNRMRANCPDLLATLFDPVATDRRGEIPEGGKPFMQIPVLNWYQGFLTVFYHRGYINSAQRFGEATRLLPAHIAALDMFDKLANDPELHLDMQLEPGDMQFVYNHSQLHDRTAFVDWPDPLRRRHLLRLWLSMDGDRPLPACFKDRYGSIDIGNRGGILVRDTQLNAPLDIES